MRTSSSFTRQRPQPVLCVAVPLGSCCCVLPPHARRAPAAARRPRPRRTRACACARGAAPPKARVRPVPGSSVYLERWRILRRLRFRRRMRFFLHCARGGRRGARGRDQGERSCGLHGRLCVTVPRDNDADPGQSRAAGGLCSRPGRPPLPNAARQDTVKLGTQSLTKPRHSLQQQRRGLARARAAGCPRPRSDAPSVRRSNRSRPSERSGHESATVTDCVAERAASGCAQAQLSQHAASGRRTFGRIVYRSSPKEKRSTGRPRGGEKASDPAACTAAIATRQEGSEGQAEAVLPVQASGTAKGGGQPPKEARRGGRRRSNPARHPWRHGRPALDGAQLAK